MPKQKDQSKYNLRSRNKEDDKRKHRSGESSDDDDESDGMPPITINLN